ncbi:homocysteine biosynthesis protein [Caldicoprobacter algeriensis]|uniref:homocysteine biosynthesis protein n=1 Tax=Caldicoprobacter algeriensis TaxID=699281 RepID=UPI00207A2738|nr:homocysteine biosynthesis protein [Caldicoprobacter algeriensis]MCM8901286.1 homocysteine biosynthesis protein [Caldicoprobacter algeriensis]
MAKTFDEINEKIKDGKVVVLTAEEFKDLVEEKGVAQAAKEVDVVTTGTFSPMCSSGAFINFGHSDPPIRMNRIWLNDVPAYGGLAAVDTYIGATELSETQGFEYGGAHVIQDLIDGKKIKLRAESYGTDCYPRKEITTYITLDDLNQAYLFNPRNAYQNYNAATNSSDRILYTYMGTLLPQYGNVTYCTSGELSPLLNDPELRTIGIGTRIFIGGAQGYVAWEGTQFVRNKEVIRDGVIQYSGVTLAVVGDMKQMSSRFIRAASYEKYGTTLFVGIGIPIPVLDEDMAKFLAVRNRDIYTQVVDYSVPSRSRPVLRKVSYEELRSGTIELNGKKVPTAPLSSLRKAREIAQVLKEMMLKGEFLLQEPIQKLPEDRRFNPLKEREVK